MNKKIWLVIAAVLVILGLIMFVSVMTVYNWDFTKLSSVKYEQNTYEISEEFEHISIETNTADIVLLPSEDGKCKVNFFEEEKQNHSVTVENGTLVIQVVDTREWHDYIGINFSTSKITVYLPNSEYNMLAIKESTGDIQVPSNFKFESVDITASTGDVKHYSSSETVKIKTSTGDIRVENISANSLDLSVSTGKVTVSGAICEGDVKINVSTGKTYLIDTKCKNLISSGNTGDISLRSVIAMEKLSIERSTGDVKFEGCDASEIFVKTDTGDVKGTLLSDKVFIAFSDTGRIDVPKTTIGDICEITTNTGDIKMLIE